MKLLNGVRERDIDLLLLEEFTCSNEFRQWFLAQTVGTEFDLNKFHRAYHSVYSMNGESDLILKFSNSDIDPCWFLIENKVDALFQPEQARRYTERKDEYINTRVCARYYTVIIAPSKYLDNHAEEVQHFNYQVDYERLRDWFINSSLGQRGQYKAEILSLALKDGVYSPIFNPVAAQNWKFCHELMQEIAPEICLPPLASNYTAGGWKELTKKNTLLGELYIRTLAEIT